MRLSPRAWQAARLTCWNIPTPAAGFDTQRGAGTATLNGRPGYELRWKLVDGGPGGANDFVRARLTGPGGTVLFRGSAAPPGKFPGSDQPTGKQHRPSCCPSA